jgi:cysteinyl-tRNA synthetase
MSSELYIYNTHKREKEKFVPINAPNVGLYVCGPTVYSEPHIGNVRTFCSFDMIYRYLTHMGYKVRYVRNITDAGHLTNAAGEGVNRMESAAKLESLEPMEVVQKYTTNFHDIMNLFNAIPPSIEPTATGHIIEQIEMIEQLIENGFAYEVEGSVYFDVTAYNEKHPYGELSGRKIEDLVAGYRDLDGQDEKRNAIDFALWKKASPEHIMQWRSPWGLGFPGWHLECSVMSTKYLGTSFDIHGGGMDLKFPHHECEIAQNKGTYNEGGARYWMHTNMLNFNGQKMSKSLGNAILPIEFITGSHDLLDKGYDPSVIRLLFMQTHYSSELDINIKGLQDAEKAWKKLFEAKQILATLEGKATQASAISEKIQSICQACTDSMNDDFNSAKVMASLFELSGIVNSIKGGQTALSEVQAADLALMTETFHSFLVDIFGLKEPQQANHDKLDDVMNVVIALRKQARENKDWATSDKIRDELKEAGIKIKDGKEGDVSYQFD